MSQADTDDRFVLECPECEFERSTDELQEAITASENHRRHTEHSMEWVRSEWELDIGEPKTVYEVACSDCGKATEFTDVDELNEFRTEHMEYTDHKLSGNDVTTREEQPIENVTLTDSARGRVTGIKEVIEMLEAEYEEGAPIEALLQLLSEQGLETSTATVELDKLKQRGEVYEPSQGRLRTT